MAKEKKENKKEKDEKKEDKKKDKNKKEDKKKDKKKDKNKKKEKKEEEEEEVKVPKKFKDIVEKIEEMSVIDLSELVKVLEKKFGVSAQPVAAAAPAQGGDDKGKEKEEEKSIYDVELTETGSNKISVIKGIREFVSIGLKEAKEMADNAPKVVKNQVPKEDAEKMKKKLEDAGAKVTLK